MCWALGLYVKDFLRERSITFYDQIFITILQKNLTVVRQTHQQQGYDSRIYHSNSCWL